jgi:hypothetical protein
MTGSLLTPKEVAALFRVGVKCIWRRCQEGRMVPPPVLPGPPYRFSAVQVQQVLDGTYQAKPEPGAARKFFGRGARVMAGGRS